MVTERDLWWVGVCGSELDCVTHRTRCKTVEDDADHEMQYQCIVWLSRFKVRYISFSTWVTIALCRVPEAWNAQILLIWTWWPIFSSVHGDSQRRRSGFALSFRIRMLLFCPSIYGLVPGVSDWKARRPWVSARLFLISFINAEDRTFRYRTWNSNYELSPLLAGQGSILFLLSIGL